MQNQRLCIKQAERNYEFENRAVNKRNQHYTQYNKQACTHNEWPEAMDQKYGKKNKTNKNKNRTEQQTYPKHILVYFSVCVHTLGCDSKNIYNLLQ